MATKKKKAPAKKASTKLEPFTHTREEAMERQKPFVPLAAHPRTRSEWEAELARLPANYPKTNFPPSILTKEAEELVQRKEDAPIFAARGVPVTPGLFTLTDDLREELIIAAGVKRDTVRAHDGFDSLEEEHAQRCRDLVPAIKLHLKANGLDLTDASGLGMAQGPLQVMDTSLQIVSRLRKVQHRLVILGDEGRALIDELERHGRSILELRSQQAGEQVTGRASSDRIHRLKHLLLHAIETISTFGLLVFNDDPTRRPAYELQHLSQYRNKSRKKVPDPAT